MSLKHTPYLLGRAEASPPHKWCQLSVCTYTCICIIISAVHPSFRIYLSSISMIYNISSVTHMCIWRRGHGHGSEHFNAMWRKRASSVTLRDTEKERLRKRRNRYQKYVVLGRQSETFWVQRVHVRLQIQGPKNKWLLLAKWSSLRNYAELHVWGH